MMRKFNRQGQVANVDTEKTSEPVSLIYEEYEPQPVFKQPVQLIYPALDRKMQQPPNALPA